jgi:hypothetical protein
MIIRSQTKREITTDLNLYIDVQHIGSNDTLRVYIRNKTVGTIGFYSTFEKAIKVLDMIQSDYVCHKGGIWCFQMPQDSEV